MIAVYIGVPILVLVGAWLFLIAPSKNSQMEKFKNVKYAHRGLHGDFGEGYAAENSLTAFKRATELGFGIELDVRISKDGEVVVFHDNTLDRVTGVCGKVSDKTLEELSKIHLSGTSDCIPSFKEVLECVSGKVPLLVEIKEDGFDHSTSEKTSEILAEYEGEYIIESFNPLSLGVVKEKLPSACRGFLLEKLTEETKTRALKYRVTQRLLLNVIARPHFISASKKRSRMFPLPIVRSLFKTPLIAWTVLSEEEEQNAYKNGFDGVIFEKYIPDETKNKRN